VSSPQRIVRERSEDQLLIPDLPEEDGTSIDSEIKEKIKNPSLGGVELLNYLQLPA
jgi:hypothetical protein